MPEQLDMPSRRQRLLIAGRGAIVAFAIIATWIGVLLVVQRLFTKSKQFRAETQIVLEQIRDGKWRELYAEAAPQLRKTISPERFEQKVLEINQSLGPFRRIIGTSSAVTTETIHGKTGVVTATIEFERATTTGEFCFQWIDGKWKSLGWVSLKIPPEIDFQRRSRTKKKKQAPGRVLDSISETLKRLDRSETRAVYDGAASLLKKAIPFDEFQQIVNERKDRLGRFVAVLEVPSSWQNDDETRSNATVLLHFKKPKGADTTVDGRFEFIREDKAWRLSKISIARPAPVLR